jgi:hypothetical protein
MRSFLAVYAHDELLRVVDTGQESRETVASHDSGFLIYAVIKAASIEEATQKARSLAKEQGGSPGESCASDTSRSGPR